MLRLSISLAYKKDLQLAEARGRNLMLLETSFSILLEGLPLSPQYKDHKLNKEYSDLEKIISKLDALFIRLLGTQLHRKTKRIIQHKQLFANQAIVDIMLHLPKTLNL